MTDQFQFSPAQIAAWKLLDESPSRHQCLFGGARSGKTVLIIMKILERALRAAGSRHLITRFRSNAVWTSIAGDQNSTLFVVARRAFTNLALKQHRLDGYFELPNGSTVWLGGLDDKERLDKILGREYCIDLDAKVLTSDLRWKRAGEITLGEELLAFPENIDNHVKLSRSIVESADIICTPRIRVTTDKGETIVSEGHYFVSFYDDKRHKNFRSLSWRKASDLRPGDKIKFACDPWETGETKADGWLAGMMDGEGWVSSRSSCGLAQKAGVALDEIKRNLQRLNIRFREHDGNGCIQLVFKGGIWPSLRLLGITRPHRLMKKAPLLWEARRGFTRIGNDRHLATITEMQSLGVGPVVAFRTSTKTLIADGFLGHNSSIYFNEASEISWSQMSTAIARLAEVRSEIPQRAYIDLNPVGKTHWTHQVFVEGKNPAARGEALADPQAYAYARLNPSDNAHNLDPEYLHALQRLPERQRKRFWEGVFVDEVEGALWTYDGIEKNRRELGVCAPHFNRVVVGVDPSGAWSDADLSADEIGIVVCASDPDRSGYILADRSCRGGPMAWALAAVKAYREFSADCIVAEINFGGAMVESTIRNVDANVPLKTVTASRGKAIRAEPISALYEQDRIHHCGRFPELEDQFCAFAADGYRGAGSPDRADAAIWALSELFGISATTGIIDYYRSLVEEDRRAGPLKSLPGRAVLASEDGPQTVILRAPRGISTAFGISGAMYNADADGIIAVGAKDAGPLERAGFERI